MCQLVGQGAPGGGDTATVRATDDTRGNARLGSHRVGLVVLLALVLLTVSVQGAGARPRAAAIERNRTSFAVNYEARLATTINAVRRSYGLHCLRIVPQLVDSAGGHSLQMARNGFFAHESLDGTSFFARIQHYFAARGFRFWSAGETLLWAPPTITANQVVARWLASPEHRAILLSRRWTVIGVGVVRSTHGPGVFQGQAVAVITADFGVRH